MARHLLLSTAAIVVFGGAAFAADLPSRRAPPVYVPPPPVFSWTGFYIGGQVGYEFGVDRNHFTGPAGVAAPSFNVGSTSAVMGGAHIGYNYQLGSTGFLGSFGGGGLVVGLEGSVDGSDNSSGVVLVPLTETHGADIEGSVRGRLGIAVDRALFYATGGAAFASVRDTYALAGGGVAPGIFTRTRVGYTVGGGVEYSITPVWSLRAEYRYTDYGYYGAAFFAAVDHPIEQTVQAGFSYKFDTPVAPVVARY